MWVISIYYVKSIKCIGKVGNSPRFMTEYAISVNNCIFGASQLFELANSLRELYFFNSQEKRNVYLNPFFNLKNI